MSEVDSALLSAAEENASKFKTRHIHLIVGPGRTSKTENPEWKGLVKAFVEGSIYRDKNLPPTGRTFTDQQLSQLKHSLKYNTDVTKALRILEGK